MKKCSNCKIEKEYTAFHKCAAKLDGHDSRCKECKKSTENVSARRRRDARRYLKTKDRCGARNLANTKWSKTSFKCAVLNCEKFSEELHHVTYEDPYAVVPLCRNHHRLNHDTCKVG